MKIEIDPVDFPLSEPCYWCHGTGTPEYFHQPNNIPATCNQCNGTGTLMTPFGQAILDHVATYGHLGKKLE